MKKTGWFSESKRHSLASQGIKTGRKTQRESYASEIAKLKRDKPFVDTDKDGVVNRFDCDPLNKNKQDFGFPKSVISGYKRYMSNREIKKALEGKVTESERLQALEELRVKKEAKRLEADEERDLQKEINAYESDDEITSDEEELIEKKKELKELKVRNQIKGTEEDIKRENAKLHKGEKSLFAELF
jgi:vacuolar-type H+-ATPase subunit I/STV1